MGLYDVQAEKRETEKRESLKKIILITIIIMCLLIFLIIGLIIYMTNQPKALSVNLDGKANNDLAKLIAIQTDDEGNIKLDENGEPIIYAPIKKVAQYFGYDYGNGNYKVASEDLNSGYVKNEYEFATFSLDSNAIMKGDSTKKTTEISNFETYKIEEKVIKNENELYTNKEGLELVFNIYIGYNSKTNSINIYTLDYYVSYYTTSSKAEGETEETTKIEDMGYSELDENFVNKKAILDGMLVVKDKWGTYGVISLKGEKIFSTQYDSLTYIPESKSFLIESNKKFGIMSVNEGETIKIDTKIKPVYDSLQLIDGEKQLYLVSQNSKYGVIDIDSNIIVPLDFTQVGIDITQFAENNITNGYILQDTLIPVEQDEKWGFYNLSGKLVGEGIVYESVGCITTSSKGNNYPVVSIPEYKSIVVSKEEKNKVAYGCIGLDGQTTLPCATEDIYMNISEGIIEYFYVWQGKTVNVKETIRND